MLAAKKLHQAHEQTVKQEKKKEQGHGPIVEIQFCTNCDAHLFAVRHQQAKYSLHYQNIKKRLVESKILVKKKAVPQNLYKKSPYCPSNVYYRNDNNQIVYFPEVGSFEVYFNGRKIFSKLESLKWPTPESIIGEVEKMLNEKREESGEIQPQLMPQKQENTVDQENKKGEFRIKSKNDEHLHFRYSIDKRNLFKKPDNNYLNRKSLTARNQSNQQSVHRKNNLNSSEKRVNEQQLPSTEGRNRKDLSDDFVIQMYQKKQAKVEEKSEENAINFPQIPKKNRRKSGGTNVYLQPIFPKTSVNLESYTRQRAIFATKLHQQRKSYEASKNQPKTKPEVDMMRESSKARFNQDCNNLFKDKQTLVTKELKNIKEATEENEIKQRQYKIQIVQAAKAVKEEAPAVAVKIIMEQSNELMPPSESQKSIHTKAPEKKDERLEEHPDEDKEQEVKPRSEQAQAQKENEEIHEPHAQPQANLQIIMDKNVHLIERAEPSNVDIDKIATTKTINEIEKSKMKSQENAYEEQFEQEDANKEFEEKNEEHLEKKQADMNVNSKVKQPEQSGKEKQPEEVYENEEFQEEKEKEEKQIQQVEALAQIVNEQVEQRVAEIL